MENTSAEDQEVIREFLVESHENLSRLDQELVELEKRPQDAASAGKHLPHHSHHQGTCGFLAFSTLEEITHQAENPPEPVARRPAGAHSGLWCP